MVTKVVWIEGDKVDSGLMRSYVIIYRTIIVRMLTLK